MAKHDRRKTSGQPPQLPTRHDSGPLPVFGVVKGVRKAFHGLVYRDHRDRSAGRGGDDGGGSGGALWPEGAPIRSSCPRVPAAVSTAR